MSWLIPSREPCQTGNLSGIHGVHRYVWLFWSVGAAQNGSFTLWHAWPFGRQPPTLENSLHGRWGLPDTMVSNMQPLSTALHRASATDTNGRLLRQRWAHLRDLLRELIVRDMKLRYRGSALGVAWTLLNPLAELLVLLFIFDVVLPLNIKNYGPFLFTGLLVYGWFQTSLTFATGAIVHNRELIRRPGVPSSILPIATVASTLVHFLLSLPILFVLLMIDRIQITSAVLMLPVLIAIQFAFTLSLAYPLATVHVWFRDTQYMLKVALQLLFYLTPVFYEVRTIPPRYRLLYSVNPMVPILEAYRDVLLRGRFPAPVPLVIVSVISAGLLMGGVTVFRRTSHRFSDEL